MTTPIAPTTIVPSLNNAIVPAFTAIRIAAKIIPSMPPDLRLFQIRYPATKHSMAGISNAIPMAAEIHTPALTKSPMIGVPASEGRKPAMRAIMPYTIQIAPKTMNIIEAAVRAAPLPKGIVHGGDG